MQINLYATFRLHAGIKRFELTLPTDASLEQAIHEIVRLYPVLKSHWLNDKNELHAHVHAFINGVDAATLPAGLNTPLQTEDVLDFFPPVAGGTGNSPEILSANRWSDRRIA